MSNWSYINGTITVNPMGETQAEKSYILDTVLAHLPQVTGSEGDMDVYVIQKKGFTSSCTCDEFGERTNNLIDRYGCKNREMGWMETQSEYILVVSGALRDRLFDQTYREFIKWLVRLGKRVLLSEVLVEVKDYDKSSIITNQNIQNEYYSYQGVFSGIFETPSWSSDQKSGYPEPNWCEYLMWDRAKDSRYPMKLAYKYYSDQENDKEVERRFDYERK